MVVLFDIDGTLIDSGGSGSRSWRAAFEKLHGVTPDIGDFSAAGRRPQGDRPGRKGAAGAKGATGPIRPKEPPVPTASTGAKGATERQAHQGPRDRSTLPVVSSSDGSVTGGGGSRADCHARISAGVYTFTINVEGACFVPSFNPSAGNFTISGNGGGCPAGAVTTHRVGQATVRITSSATSPCRRWLRRRRLFTPSAQPSSRRFRRGVAPRQNSGTKRATFKAALRPSTHVKGPLAPSLVRHRSLEGRVVLQPTGVRRRPAPPNPSEPMGAIERLHNPRGVAGAVARPSASANALPSAALSGGTSRDGFTHLFDRRTSSILFPQWPLQE